MASTGENDSTSTLDSTNPQENVILHRLKQNLLCQIFQQEQLLQT